MSELKFVTHSKEDEEKKTRVSTLTVTEVPSTYPLDEGFVLCFGLLWRIQIEELFQ